MDKIIVQGEEKHPGVWERDWPNSRAWKVIVWTCSFKRLCGSENWDCFFKWGADRTTEMKELSSLRVKQTLEWKKNLTPSGGEFQKWQLKGKDFTEMTSKKGRPNDCSTTIGGWWRQKLHKWCEESWKMRCGRLSRRLKSCTVWKWEEKKKKGSKQGYQRGCCLLKSYGSSDQPFKKVGMLE